MILFSPIRTKRLSVNLRETTVGDTIHLCSIPPTMFEAGTSEVLARIVVDDPRAARNSVTDQRLWTVQERYFVVSRYIAQTAEGDPNFKVGDGAYLDYCLDGADHCPDFIELGEIEGDRWRLRPLLGAHAVTIERLIAMGELEPKRYGWWLGAMAAQMFQHDNPGADAQLLSDADLEATLIDRVKVLRAYPTSAFEQMLFLFLNGMSALDHLFRIEFLDDGIALSPKRTQGKEVPGLPPARFPHADIFSDTAQTVFGKPL